MVAVIWKSEPNKKDEWYHGCYAFNTKHEKNHVNEIAMKIQELGLHVRVEERKGNI